MHNRLKYQSLSVFMFLLLPLTIFLFARINIKSPAYLADKGILTLSEAESSNIHMLGGSLEYWKGALEPEQLYLSQPSLTQDIRFHKQMEGNTFRFTIENENDLWFLLPRPHQSRIWVNAIEVLPSAGSEWILATDLFHIGDYGTAPYEFVLQVKGSSPYYGYQGVLFGSNKNLSILQTLWMVLDVLSVGIALMLIIVCLALYLNKKSERYLIMLIVCALLNTAHFMLIPRHSAFSFFHLGSVSLYSQFFVLYYFACRQFLPDLIPKWVDRLIIASIFLFSCLLFMFPIYTSQIIRFFTILYWIIQFFYLSKGCLHDIPEAPVLLGGAALVLGNTLFYMLIDFEQIPQGIMDIQIMPAQYTFALYMIAFSIATCMKFARKFQVADTLSGNLELLVLKQTQELREANSRILDFQKQKQHFITGIAHNLRNPLFALGGYLDLMTEEHDDVRKQHYLDLMNDKITYLSKMTRDLLFYSRLEEGQVEFRFSSFLLKPLLTCAADDAKVRFSSKSVTIHIDCSETLTIVADQYSIRQIVDNLLDNAARHSYENGKIEITAFRQDNNTLILFRDYGSGIEPDILPDLFHMGIQEGASQKGIGLSIVSLLLKAHNGEIKVNNEKDGGAKFVILLPDE